VCLTVVEKHAHGWDVEVSAETLSKTTISDWAVGAEVNLERSVRPEDRLSGHIVRGVVETTCTLDSLTPEGDAIIARYRVAPEYLRYIAMKGPVCLDGASLTVMAKDEESFSVSLVQYTQEHTNLTRRTPGASINLETDLIARYVEQILEARAAT
jgi:riboflavin synthase